MPVNETNIVKIYLHICIKFLKYKILFCQLKLVSTISVLAIKLLKNYQKCFLLYQKTPFVLKIFKLLYFPPPLFFPFLAIADFIEEVD